MRCEQDSLPPPIPQPPRIPPPLSPLLSPRLSPPANLVGKFGEEKRPTLGKFGWFLKGSVR